MDDSLKTLDLSAEGTVSVPPVVPTPPTAPLGASTPPAPQPTIVTQSSGPTDKKPMGKKTKIIAGVLSVLVLLSGLGVGIFLSKQKQLSAIKAGGPNICTWETCGDDPNKWAAGAAAAEGKAQENPGVAAIVNQIVETAANTSNNGSVGNQIEHIEAVLNTNLNESEKQALNGVLNTSQQQALSGALAPVTVTSGPTLSNGAGGVKTDRTGQCQVCGGLTQGGCDNMTTGDGQRCGFGCLGGLHFCANSGSCQASCPAGQETAGPASSNPAAFACLTTGVGCGVGGAIGLTKTATALTSTVATNQQTLADAKSKFSTSNCAANLTCSDFTGAHFCITDAPGGVVGNPNGCNQALQKMTGQQFYGGTRTTVGGSVSGGTWNPSENVYEYTIVYKGTTYTIKFNPATKLVTGIPQGLIARLYDCPVNDKYWSNTSVYGCGESDTVDDPLVTMSLITTSSLTLSNSCGIQQFDIDTGTGPHISLNFRDESGCGTTTTTTTTTMTNTPTGGTNPSPSNPPSGSNPTPTPTTTTQSYACYQLSIMKNGNNISAASVQVGDSLIMRGFATATNTTVSKMRFVVSINGVAQAPVDVNASLISGMYQADIPYTITQAASYSVTTTPISP